MLRGLLAAAPRPPGPELTVRPTEAKVIHDRYCGMASVPLPSLSAGGCVGNEALDLKL